MGTAFNRPLVQFVQSKLRALANPDDAGPMQAYMKTDMPFYGVKKPARLPLYRALKKDFIPGTRAEYESAVRALWALPHREERYAALEFARVHTAFRTPDALPLLERLMREGAWWDLVDFVVSQIVSPMYLERRVEVRPVIERWIEDDEFWIRRAALLAQLKHRDATDEAQLFDHCLRRADETEFFIRKAIGWALRDYSAWCPTPVARFLKKHRSTLSPLSYREGAKRLVREGVLEGR